MALFEIKAYKCEWCGRVFEHEESHWDCQYDPKARTCVSCARSAELKMDAKHGTGIVYCPRADEMFKYPHNRYCPDYIRQDDYQSFNPKGGAE